MSDHIEFVPNAPVAKNLKEDLMLSSPPHPGAHVAGLITITFWYNPQAETMEADVLVQPEDERYEVIHWAHHILGKILQNG